MNTTTDRTYQFNTGDRIRVVREFYHYEAIPVGTEGTVDMDWMNENGPYISRITHATMNGGGHDVPIILDDGRRIRARVGGSTTFIERI